MTGKCWKRSGCVLLLLAGYVLFEFNAGWVCFLDLHSGKVRTDMEFCGLTLWRGAVCETRFSKLLEDEKLRTESGTDWQLSYWRPVWQDGITCPISRCLFTDSPRSLEGEETCAFLDCFDSGCRDDEKKNRVRRAMLLWQLKRWKNFSKEREPHPFFLMERPRKELNDFLEELLREPESSVPGV